MALYLSPLTAIVQYFTNAGVIAPGATVQTQVAGSVSTLQTTFTDSTGLVPNANPLTLSASGRAAGASGALTAFWVAAGVSIDAIFTDTLGETWALRNLQGINDPTFSTSNIQTLLANPNSAGGTGTGPVGGADYVANAVKSYDTIADLRAANTPVLTGVQTLNVSVQGGAAINDGLGGDFYYNATSAATDPGGSSVNVVKPVNNAGNGRYLRMFTPPFGAQTTIASAATTDLGTLPTNVVSITGTTTITSLGSSASLARPVYLLGFTGILLLTNSASLALPAGANITTAAGDTAWATYAGAGNWVIISYNRASAATGSLGVQNSVLAADSAAVNNSTVLVDTGLTATLVAGATYQVQMLLSFLGATSTAQGYQFKFNYAGTQTGKAVGAGTGTQNAVPAAISSTDMLGFANVASAVNITNPDPVVMTYSIIANAGGLLKVQFAQNAATAANLVLKAGSTMIVTRVL